MKDKDQVPPRGNSLYFVLQLKCDYAPAGPAFSVPPNSHRLGD